MEPVSGSINAPFPPSLPQSEGDVTQHYENTSPGEEKGPLLRTVSSPAPALSEERSPKTLGWEVQAPGSLPPQPLFFPIPTFQIPAIKAKAAAERGIDPRLPPPQTPQRSAQGKIGVPGGRAAKQHSGLGAQPQFSWDESMHGVPEAPSR